MVEMNRGIENSRVVCDGGGGVSEAQNLEVFVN